MIFSVRMIPALLIVPLMAVSYILPLHADENSTDQAQGQSEAPTSQVLGLSDEVLAKQGSAVLTQGEIDAVFSAIPPEHRLAYIRSGQRVDQAIGAWLRTKLLAEEARAAGFDQEPLVKNRMSLEAEKQLASAWLERVLESAPEADYETLAEEFYIANPEAFRTEELIDVSHILIGFENRGSAEAKLLAQSLSEQLQQDPSRFEALVQEYSDDPSKATNEGQFPAMGRGQMVEAFEKAAFTLENPGDISAPVETQYGFHLIRLNARQDASELPFEAVKEQAMQQAKAKYLTDYRARYVNALQTQPIEMTQEAVNKMVRRYFGENLELAPKFED